MKTYWRRVMNNPFRENAADDIEVRKHRITEEETTKRARE